MQGWFKEDPSSDSLDPCKNIIMTQCVSNLDGPQRLAGYPDLLKQASFELW